MPINIFLLGLHLLAVCHGKTINTTPADPEPATPEDVYKPPTFNHMNNSKTSEHPIQSNNTSNPRSSGFAQIEEDIFLRTAEKYFNFHLGTLAVNLPARNNSNEPVLGWHMAIYSKSGTSYEQICGGSLVTKDVVLSAAHCFWDEGGLIPAGQFAVAGGKLYRQWNRFQVHQSNVSEIIIKPRFRGIKTNFQEDIAIVRLETGFSYDYGVKPLCVNFDRALERRQLRNGNLGIILGFGLTEENGPPSERLNYQNLPYVEIEDCFQASEPDFFKYLTSDKICAGDQKSGRAVCHGDSGGGLVFFVGDQNDTKSIPFLRGIASTAPRNENECNAFAIGSFTDVRTHRTFLRDHIPGLEEECEKVYEKELNDIAKKLNTSTSRNPQNGSDTTRKADLSVVARSAVLIGFEPSHEATTPVNTLKPDVKQTVNEAGPDNSLPDGESDSNDESYADAKIDDGENEDKKDPDFSRTLLKPAPAVGESSAPAYHWHVAVYTKKTKPYLQICGGTLVKTNVIISAAHCFHDQVRLLSPKLFAAAAGKLHRPWGDPRDEYAQYSDIKQIRIPGNFTRITNSIRSCYQHDVAAVTLAAPFTYAPGVRAACVDFGAELNIKQLAPGSFGKFPGWSRPDRECEPAQRLSSRDLPFVHLGCSPDSPLSSSPDGQAASCVLVDLALSDDRVPAYVRVPAPCFTDSGGGLTYLVDSTNVPYLRGVATTDPGIPKCDIFIMDSFIELRDNREFLQDVVPGLEEECDVAYPVKGEGEETEAAGGETNVLSGQTAGDTNKNQPSVINNEPHKTEPNHFDINTGFDRQTPSTVTGSHDTVPASANSNGTRPSERQHPLAGNRNFNNIQIANFDNIPFTNASLDPSKLNAKPVYTWRKRNQTTEKPVDVSYPIVGSMAVPMLGNSSSPSFQWHVGVYSKAWTPYMQICGGSLVKRDVVLSAAHCFWSDEFGPQAPAQFAVAAGKRRRPWADSRDAGAQYSHVRELIFPDRFVGIKMSLQDDIAVVRLTKPFEYAPAVQPICVDFSLETERQQLRQGRSGILAGWGLTENDGGLSQQLNYIELPFVDVKDCIRGTNPALLKYITSDKICAGDKKTRRYLCRSDAGGGLAFIDTYPTIRGISSQAFAGLCETVTIAPQTLLSFHATFLRDNVLDIERECQDFYGLGKIGRNIGGYSGLGGLGNGNLNLICNCNCNH